MTRSSSGSTPCINISTRERVYSFTADEEHEWQPSPSQGAASEHAKAQDLLAACFERPWRSQDWRLDAIFVKAVEVNLKRLERLASHGC